MNKYAHLLTDITELNPTLEAFEVGARGTITDENKVTLKKLHKFVDKTIPLKQFISKISEICVVSSYYIFLQRKEPAWNSPGLLSYS